MQFEVGQGSRGTSDSGGVVYPQPESDSRRIVWILDGRPLYRQPRDLSESRREVRTYRRRRGQAG